MSEFVKSKTRVNLTPGVSIGSARELMEWSQNEVTRGG